MTPRKTRSTSATLTFVRLVVCVVFVYPFRMAEHGFDYRTFDPTPGSTHSTAAEQACELPREGLELLARCTVSFGMFWC